MTKVSRRNGIAARLLRGTRLFVHDERGAVAVMFALMLTALLGMLALAIDLGKAWNAETELQNAADAGALAGVTQLDGAADARVRAIRAVVSEIASNRQHFSTDGTDADDDGSPDGLEVRFDKTETIDNTTGIADNRDIKFYSVMPTIPANEAISDAEARFIEVNVFPREVDFSFAAIVGAVDSASPRGRAVAGYEIFECEPTPLMVCNPNEPDPAPEDENGNPIQTPFKITEGCPVNQFGAKPDNFDDGNAINPNSCIGRGVTMKEHTGGGHLFPGEWGYLSIDVIDQFGNITELKGAGQVADALAQVSPGAVCRGNTVTTRPGTVASIGRYLNMRLDLYFDSDYMSDENYQPAPNVIKGLVPVAGWDPDTDLCRFNTTSPQDTGSSDWIRPDDSYDGPGLHWDPDADAVNFDEVSGGNPIQAMSYPRDACAYAAADTDLPNFQDAYAGTPMDDAGGGGNITRGVASCVFVPRPGDTVTTPGAQIGTGQWDIYAYLARYHPKWAGGDISPQSLEAKMLEPTDTLYADRPTQDANTGDIIEPPDGRISRFEMYLWERSFLMPNPGSTYPENMPMDDWQGDWFSTAQNKAGIPQCYNPQYKNVTIEPLPEGVAEDALDRRVIVMAVVNCGTVQGGGHQTLKTAPGDGRIGVFLAEPMGEWSPDAIYGEIVDPRGLQNFDGNAPKPIARKHIVLIE